MKRKILTILLLSTLISSPLLETISYATEVDNIVTEQESQNTEFTENESQEGNYIDDIRDIEFAPVTINYILEGVDKPLKTSKILNTKEYFWDNYTVKLSNKLLYGGIDIQDEIRNYYFSHYEINGRRIESIDAIITTSEEESVINVVYSEEIPKDGYLRKGFRNGIAIDFNYLSQQSNSNSFALTDLYDNSWVLNLPSEFCSEFKENNENLVNANDKTLYINADVNPISDKEQTVLTKQYDYMAGIKISTSMGYDDFKNPVILTYTPDNINSDIENTEAQLFGINLEGKIEELSSSTAIDNSFEFSVNKNFNKYQFLFVAASKDTNDVSNTIENANNDNQNSSLSNTTTSNANTGTVTTCDDSVLSPNATEETIVTSNELNETAVALLILVCFSAGAVATYILSLILSIRNENIKKKNKKEK